MSWKIVPKAAIYFVLALQISIAQANVVGTGFQTFNPTHDGLDYVTVESSLTLDPGVANFGFFANKSWNTLPYYESIYLGAPTAGRSKYTDSLLSGDTSFALGLMPRWEVGFSVANIFDQDINTDGDQTVYGAFNAKGINEYKLSTKLNFYKVPKFGASLALSANFNQILDDPFAGSKSGPTVNYQLIFDTRFGSWNFAVNGGFRSRKPGAANDDVIVPLKNDYIASVGGSYLIESTNTKLILEYFASEPAQKAENISSKARSNREVLFGIKQDLSPGTALHIGATKEAMQGTASPDLRIYAGLNLAFTLWEPEHKIVEQRKVEIEAVKKAREERYDLPEDTRDANPAFFDDLPRSSEELEASSPVPNIGDITPATPTAIREEFRMQSLHFVSGSSNLVYGDFKKYMNSFVQHLNKDPGFRRLTIRGHTDTTGKRKFNIDLSRKRAAALKNFLVKEYKVPQDKIETMGFGPDIPIADNSNYQGRKLNRRVEFVIDR